MSAEYDLVAVGDVMVDVIAPPPGAEPRHVPVEIHAGGSAVNAARAAAAHGARAAVAGCIGDDLLGRMLREEVETLGVDALLTEVPGERTGRVLYTGGGVLAERGANAAFAAEHVPDVDAHAVLVSGYQLLRSDSGPGTAAALALGGLLGIDLGSARLVRSFGVEATRRLVAGADVVLGGEEAVEALGELDGPLVVTTLGREGARAGMLHVRPRHTVAGEILGAGDAFAAALLLALAEGTPTGVALRRACAAGAAVGR